MLVSKKIYFVALFGNYGRELRNWEAAIQTDSRRQLHVFNTDKFTISEALNSIRRAFIQN